MDSKKTDDLFVWSAPVRPFKKRDREFYTTALALAFLLIVISIFLREWLLIGSILAVVFVGYTLATVPPPTVTNKITKKGVWAADRFYKYSELYQYWFEKQLESTVLVLIQQQHQTRTFIVIPDDAQEKINALLKDQIVYREKPLRSAVETIVSWLSRKVPLEEPKKTSR